jgi:hypothetical protein
MGLVLESNRDENLENIDIDAGNIQFHQRGVLQFSA